SIFSAFRRLVFSFSSPLWVKGFANSSLAFFVCFFFQAEDGIRDRNVTGVQTCALPIDIMPSKSLSITKPSLNHSLDMCLSNSLTAFSNKGILFKNDISKLCLLVGEI